jgi:hypothetical protein
VSGLQSLPEHVSKAQACRALKVPRHRCYPDQRRRYRSPPGASHRRALSPTEDQALLEQLHCARLQDAAPRQIHATLLGEGVLIASVSTLYRPAKNTSGKP